MFLRLLCNELSEHHTRAGSHGAGITPISLWESRATVSELGQRAALDWSILTHPAPHRVILQPMQQPAPAQPSSNPSSFAGLLATLASPPPQAAEDESLWSTSDLGEDVATLSYERALRTHARYRPADRRVDRESDRFDELPAPPVGAGVDDGAVAAIGTNAADAADTASAATPLPTGVATDRDLRSASVTIRMNKAECARLRERAAEAGLTVSAYLRSCALEAEALRAEVKQALAELKAGNGAGARERGSKQTDPHGIGRVRLTKVFGRIGKLCIGVASEKPA